MHVFLVIGPARDSMVLVACSKPCFHSGVDAFLLMKLPLAIGTCGDVAM